MGLFVSDTAEWAMSTPGEMTRSLPAAENGGTEAEADLVRRDWTAARGWPEGQLSGRPK